MTPRKRRKIGRKKMKSKEINKIKFKINQIVILTSVRASKEWNTLEFKAVIKKNSSVDQTEAKWINLISDISQSSVKSAKWNLLVQQMNGFRFKNHKDCVRQHAKLIGMFYEPHIFFNINDEEWIEHDVSLRRRSVKGIKLNDVVTQSVKEYNFDYIEPDHIGGDDVCFYIIFVFKTCAFAYNFVIFRSNLLNIAFHILVQKLRVLKIM